MRVEVMSKVVRVDRSPMNAKRWCLSLACGHDVWVTRSRRPTAKSHPCEACSRAREATDAK